MMNWLVHKLYFGVAAPNNCEGGGCATAFPDVAADDSSVQALLSVAFGAAAAIAVLVIIISAFNIVTGGGDSEKISRSKNSIIFALVGLAIAVSAEIIVLTVLKRI